MDLMTQTTTYAQLKQKYRGFGAPTAKILVDGVDLAEKYKTLMSLVEVELTCDYPASGASFEIIGEYQPDQTDFNSSGAFRQIELGAKVEIRLGYIATETVFSGLITEIRYEFTQEAEPCIHVGCMDAKCLLMKSQRLEICKEKKLTQAVTALLSAQPVAAYLSGKKIETPGGEEEPIAIHMQSDYDFIVRQAQHTGSEFFLFCGTAYFRPQPSSGQPLMTLKRDELILEATLSLRGEDLVKEVRVVGHEGEAGTARSSGSFGKGAGPKRMLADTQRVYLDARAVSQASAQQKAKALMQAIQNQFGLLECTCTGLPELVPGRLVRISGLMGRAEGAFYIVNVRHRIGQDGFTTTFEARINSL